MRLRNALLGFMGTALLLTSGCDSAANVELIDLDKVLKILVTVIDKQDGAGTGEGAEAQAKGESGEAGAIVAIDPAKQDPAKEKKFCTDFAKALNDAKLLSSKIGVQIDTKGDIIGFKDANGNNTKDGTDAQLFTIQIDEKGQRLIASDNQGHSRPHRYRSGGMFHGFLLGSMLGRHNSYYSGSRASMKPNFTNKTMSPTNYHSTALAKAKATARAKSSSFSSSSRSRSGSGGFSFGK